MDALQDEELSDPIEAFAKLSQRVQDGQLDTKRSFAQTLQAIALVQEQTEQALTLVQQRAELALAKAMKAAAPDYTNDIKELKRAVQAIEKKPALGLTVEILGASIQGACTQGNAAALSALQSAAAGYTAAQGKEALLLSKLQTASWRFFASAAVGLLLTGGVAGYLINQAMVDQILSHRERPVITLDVEKVAADLATQFHGLCAAKASGAKGR